MNLYRKYYNPQKELSFHSCFVDDERKVDVCFYVNPNVYLAFLTKMSFCFIPVLTILH